MNSSYNLQSTIHSSIKESHSYEKDAILNKSIQYEEKEYKEFLMNLWKSKLDVIILKRYKIDNCYLFDILIEKERFDILFVRKDLMFITIYNKKEVIHKEFTSFKELESHINNYLLNLQI